MAISRQALGMNARNFLYLRPFNKNIHKRLADDKLLTKRALAAAGIPVVPLISVFEDRSAVRAFDWDSLDSSFAIKPAHGYGGEGIVIIDGWDGDVGETPSGEEIERANLESHIYDILEGAYSLHFLPDVAFIEEKLAPERFFRKILTIGIPDMRIIVFNGIPVMAMLRVPSIESGGRANIHQGAIAVGIDIASGITTGAVLHGKPLRFFPGTKTKPHGLKIPYWDEILRLAVKTQEVIPLGLCGVDIVIDINYGPIVIEVNARPGLSIQIANRASLRTRLERVGNMKRPAIDRGIGIARSLFAEPFSEKITPDEPEILGVIEPVTIMHGNGSRDIRAKVDTGAYRTSIDETLAEELNLPEKSEQVFVQSASGSQKRQTVEITFQIGGKTINSLASVADRSSLRYPMIIGRHDLAGFLVDPKHGDFEEEDTEI
ncbi:aspartyl protease family protein [bacterium]|nr:aspartyl protease family protein [bacterium]MCI0566367.1 aspartyl protease family protein [bacterium]MCI0680075.1 aspartyl protease family protein [bacterium]